MYSIVIPACNTNEKCKPLLENLLTSIVWGQYKQRGCPIIVCWDNCDESFIHYFESNYPFIHSLPYEGESNLNFCKNANRGLRYVHKELNTGLFLVNLDTVLPNRIALETIRNKGISSPTSRHIDGDLQLKVQQLNQWLDPGCPCNTNKVKPVENTHKFAAFCTWISKEAMDTIGYLDENTFIASFEDDDYCLRACLAGLPCEVYNGITVHHELKNRDPAKGEQISTTGSYDLPQLGDHMGRFMRKWNIPPWITHAQFPSYILETWKGLPLLYVD